ncbi:MAG: hypothetical protein ACFFAN_10600 [Promethearchaeota archaeon]
MNLKNHKNRKFLLLIVLLVLLTLNLSMFFLKKEQNSIITKKQEKIKLFVAQESDTTEWFIESHTEEWLENGDFENDDEEWEKSEEGDESDVDAYISDGEAHYKVLGDSGQFSLIVDPSNQTELNKWKRSVNPDYLLYPHFNEINSSGFHVSHLWDENVADGQDENAPSVRWNRTVTLPIDISNYIIISASVEAKFNATVQAKDREGGGIEVPGDATDGGGVDIYQNDTLDHAIFSVEISNLNNDYNYLLASNETRYLGDDDVIGDWDNITDTPMKNNVDEGLLITQLTSVLNDDPSHRSFLVFLGIDIICADNDYGNDVDNWKSLIIRSLNLTFSYEKKIEKHTSISWEQEGDEISGKNVEITGAVLNFDYKVNNDWPSASPNSEIRILINDKEHSETIELIEGETSFEEIDKDGFDVADLISKDKDISLEIQVYIADSFSLDKDITISIDEISLEISYDLLIAPEQSILFQILLIIAIVAGGCLASYLVYYQRVLKYPKSVRKIRKYRRTLKKSKSPNVSIISREKSFNSIYAEEIDKFTGLLKGKALTKTTTKDKMVAKSIEMSSNNRSEKSLRKKINNKPKENLRDKKFSLLIIILCSSLFLNILILPLNANLSTRAEETQLKSISLAQDSDAGEWFIESHTEEWLENGDFEDDDEKWESSKGGDKSDVDTEISNGEAKYRISGDSGEFSFIIDTSKPEWNVVEWNKWKASPKRENWLLPHYYEVNSSGFHISHNWIEGSGGIEDDNTPSIYWKRNVTLPVDMSDYIITSASINAEFNATVEAIGAGALPYEGGIDVPGDETSSGGGNPQNDTLDYARFSVEISPLDDEKYNFKYLIAHNRTIYLGDDDNANINREDNLTDTPFTSKANENLLKAYLTSLLDKDPLHRSFNIILGIDIFCADNYVVNDQDNWKSLIIRSLNLTFSYEKKINQLTTVSWEQEGEEISGRNIDITDAELNFDYKINEEWNENLSPNSEIVILINDKEHTETIELSEAETSFEEASDEGFDVTDLIKKDKDITLTIQIFIADEFGLDHPITISIDDVSLEISYDVLIPPEQSLLFQILFIIACVGAGCIAGYLVYYKRVLKYPKPVRKVRKYRKKLRKIKIPNIPIVNREDAFNELYATELGNTAIFLKEKPSKQIDTKDKIINKPLETPNDKTDS